MRLATIRTAADITLAQMGVNVLQKAQGVDPEIAEEVELRTQKMKVPSFQDLKKLALNPKLQQEAISALVSPKAAIKEVDIKAVKDGIVEKLF